MINDDIPTNEEYYALVKLSREQIIGFDMIDVLETKGWCEYMENIIWLPTGEGYSAMERFEALVHQEAPHLSACQHLLLVSISELLDHDRR